MRRAVDSFDRPLTNLVLKCSRLPFEIWESLIFQLNPDTWVCPLLCLKTMMRNSYAHLLLAALFFAQSVLFFPHQALAISLRVTPKAGGSVVAAELSQGKSAISQAVEELSAGPAAVLPAGHPLRGSLGVPVVKAGQVVGNIIVDGAKKKVNVVSLLRKARAGAWHVLKELPAESLAFFIGVGALNESNLVLNYADNPVLSMQHMMSHDYRTADGLIGGLGFYAFMLGNRGTMAMAQTYLKPGSRLNMFVPYKAMTIGFMASNIIHEIAHFGDLKKCVAALNERISDDEKFSTCEKAYDSWAEVGIEKMQEYAPTLMAMVTSTILAGVVEEFTIKKVIRAVGWGVIVEVATKGNPYGFTITALRWSYKIVNIMLFTEFQMLHEPGLTQWFKNWADGDQLAEAENSVLFLLDQKKRNGWNPKPANDRLEQYDLDLAIHKFIDRAKEWRRGNMMDILNSHGAWQSFLMDMTTTYKAALDFDTFFAEEYKKRYYLGKPSLIDAPAYLAGVKTAGVNNGATLDLLNNKADFENRQYEHLMNVRANWEEMITKTDAKDLTTYATEFRELREILDYLPPKVDWENIKELNLPRIAKGLDLLNQKVKVTYNRQLGISRPLLKTPENPEGNSLLEGLRADIGAPFPLYEPGQAFFHAYDRDGKRAEILNSMNAPSHWKQRISYIRPSQYLFTQILDGPRADQGQAIFKEKSGYPAQFLPPRLVDNFKYEIHDFLKQGSVAATPTIFNTPISVSGHKYRNAFAVVLGNNLLKSIFVNEKNEPHEKGFMEWWNKNVESKYIQGWNKYENEYQKIMVKTLERYHFAPAEEKQFGSWWDKLADTWEHLGDKWKEFRVTGMKTGPLANGLKESMLQERRFYLMLLGEILREQTASLGENHPLLKAGAQDPVVDLSTFPLSQLTSNDRRRQAPARCKVPTAKQYQECVQANTTYVPNIPVLKIMAKNEVYNFSKLVSTYARRGIKPYGNNQEKITRHYEIQDQLNTQFNELANLIEQMKITAVDGGKYQIQVEGGTIDLDLTKKIVVSSVLNKQISEVQDKIGKTIADIQQQLKDSGLKAKNTLAYNSAIATLRGLEMLSMQQGDIGRIINSVSYTRSVDGEDASGRSSLCSSLSMSSSRKNTFGQKPQKFERRGCSVLSREMPAKESEVFRIPELPAQALPEFTIDTSAYSSMGKALAVPQDPTPALTESEQMDRVSEEDYEEPTGTGIETNTNDEN